MSSEGQAGAASPWAAQIESAAQLGTGMGAGARLTGVPEPLPTAAEELERTRRIFGKPPNIDRLVDAVGLPFGHRHPAAGAVLDAFCSALVAAFTSDGPLPGLWSRYASKGAAQMLLQAGAADPDRPAGQQQPAGVWPAPPSVAGGAPGRPRRRASSDRRGPSRR